MQTSVKLSLLFVVSIMSIMSITNAFHVSDYDDNYGSNNDGNKYGNVRCDVCDLSIIAIEDYLDSNHTIAELEQSLDTICSKTPLSTLCTNLVNSYLPQVITYLKQKESPQTICNQLGFCSTKPSIHYKYDFCNSLFRLYTKLRQNKMYYFSDDCITHDCAKTSVIISKHVYSYLHTFVMTHRICNGLLLPSMMHLQ